MIPSTMTDDELARAAFLNDQALAGLVDDTNSPLWDERQALAAEISRRGQVTVTFTLAEARAIANHGSGDDYVAAQDKLYAAINAAA